MKSRRGEKCTVITRNDLERSKYEPSQEINKLYHKWNVYNKIYIVSSFVTCFSCVLYTVFFPHARRITINNEKFQIRSNKLTMRLRPRLVWRFQTFAKIRRAKKDKWKYRDLNHWTIVKEWRTSNSWQTFIFFSHDSFVSRIKNCLGRGVKKHAHDTCITTADWRLSDKLFLIGLI